MKHGFVLLFAFICTFALAQTHEELIYGHKDGMALTMEKVKPAKPNGKAILYLMSGGYNSSYTWLDFGLKTSKQFTDHGYTVFLVFHGSQPRYNVSQITSDITRAVQFVRYNAKKFGIDPDHIGMHGASSGGHLTLYAATADDAISKDSKDPIERVSSKLQAVAVFYPPTDFINFGEANANITIDKKIASERQVSAAFDFRTWNDSLQVYDIPSSSMELEIAKRYSPLYLVTKDDAPAYLVHGDKDWVVPLQQSEVLVVKYKSTGVPIELVVKPGAEHGWKDEGLDREKMVTWFDKYLK